MIQGGSRFSKDIPPYIIAGREPITYSGINIIGLRRRGFSNEVIENIHNAYRIILPKAVKYFRCPYKSGSRSRDEPGNRIYYQFYTQLWSEELLNNKSVYWHIIYIENLKHYHYDIQIYHHI